jgi:hypothetical protein
MLPCFIRITNKTSTLLVIQSIQSCAHNILIAASIAEIYFEHSSSNGIVASMRIEAIITTVHVK